MYGADILGMMWGEDMRNREEEKAVLDNNRPPLSGLPINSTEAGVGVVVYGFLGRVIWRGGWFPSCARLGLA